MPMISQTLQAGLESVARRTGFSLREIHAIARMVAQASYDPLPPDQWGGVHDDWSREQIFDLDDLTTLVVNVPKPDAQIDLLLAWEEFRRDTESTSYALTRDPSIGALLMIVGSGEAWSTFWAVRHPNPEVRAIHTVALVEIEALRQEIKVRAEAMTARRQDQWNR
jgi:hypothetical protein